MDFTNHPINQIQKLLESQPHLMDAKFQFAKFSYDYNSNRNITQLLFCKGASITKPWLIQHISSLKKNFELSFHSRIIYQNEIFHLPMIDFNMESIDNDVLTTLIERFEKQIELRVFRNVFSSMAMYSSGNSYHGYSDTLLKCQEWQNFMAASLLLNYNKNLDEKSILVDTRWIAHRLIQGYGALRWSNNNNKYNSEPNLVLNSVLKNN